VIEGTRSHHGSHYGVRFVRRGPHLEDIVRNVGRDDIEMKVAVHHLTTDTITMLVVEIEGRYIDTRGHRSHTTSEDITMDDGRNTVSIRGGVSPTVERKTRTFNIEDSSLLQATANTARTAIHFEAKLEALVLRVHEMIV
jgi:hypothetical protein